MLTRGLLFVLGPLDRRPAPHHQLRQRLVEAYIACVRAFQPALGLGQLDFVEQAAISPPEPHPFDGLALQPPPGLLDVAPLVQPALQRRPATDQRLVGDIDLAGCPLSFVLCPLFFSYIRLFVLCRVPSGWFFVLAAAERQQTAL